MRVRLQGPLAAYELRHWADRELDEEPERFDDEHAAASLVRQLLVEGGEGLALRSLVERSSFELASLDPLDEDDLVARLAGALVRGTMIALRFPHTIMTTVPPELLEHAPEPLEPEEIVEPESVWMRPQADSEWLTLTVFAEPETLGLATSHQAR